MNGPTFPGDCPDFRVPPRSGGTKMGLSPLPADELRALADMACDGVLREDDATQLERLLHGNIAAQQFYLTHVSFDRRLRWVLTHEVPAPTAPPSSPLVLSLGSAVYGTAGFFSSGWPVAYLIATVIFGIGLLIGSHVYMSGPEQLARQSAPNRISNPQSLIPNISPKAPPVGRITGMVDCQFDQSSRIADSKTEDLRPKTLLSLGDKFALASGLLEITYDTDAKVILQGPVTYEAEANGGYLSIGKLTGKLETKPQAPRPKAPDLSSFILHPSSFVIRTPTATVTDLGTEFGVEVSKEGHTTSHVYRGSVRLQVTSSDGKVMGAARILHENESARVEEDTGKQGGGNHVTVFVAPATSTSFVREIPEPTIKTLDLVDVVAGGDGFSGRRNRGIDPTDGRACDTGPKSPHDIVAGDGKYHRVEELPFVDGVFIPDGRAGPVQIDSAGHTFADCPGTSNRTGYCYIWAGGADPAERPSSGIGGAGIGRSELSGIDYASPGHGLLGMTSNKGITFDLDAIRRANPGYKLLRFRAVAGDTEPESEKGGRLYLADVWVLVDGRTRFRRQITGRDGAYSVVFSINQSDRFLTLAATDGGDDIASDWVIFGDPRLELKPAKTDAAFPSRRDVGQ